MRYAFKIAFRQLVSSPGQTSLLVLGVALGVFVFIFMSALIGGLATVLTQRTVGNIAHVVIEAQERDPRMDLPGALVAVQRDLSRRQQIRDWQPILDLVTNAPNVVAVSPQIRGSAFLIRGQAAAPVGIIGVEPANLSAISAIEDAVVEGSPRLPVDGILIGRRLATDLGLRVGQSVRLRSDRGRERSLIIGGIFSLGVASADRQAAYMSLAAARALFDLPTGVSRIELKLSPVEAAPATADYLRRATGLKVTAWTDENVQLFEALGAQAQTGTVLKTFALVTIIVGIASAMLLSIVRRRAQIGIMRAVGARSRFILGVFILEGTLIGLGGALFGASMAWLALSPFPPILESQPGTLPVDQAQGSYLTAIVLTVLAAALASILPARSASRVDPVEAIGQ